MVVSIIAIITIIVLPNYRSSNQYLALERSAHKLHHDIRRAQEMSMSAIECPSMCPIETQTNPCNCDGSVPSGYGIYFQVGDNNYIIYADHNPNEAYDGFDDIISQIDLEGGIEIQSIAIEGVGAAQGGVNFKSPDPTLNIHNNVVSKQSWIRITIALQSDATRRKSIIVNQAGSIYVE